MLPTLYFKAKSKFQAMDSPGSSFQRTDVTRWSVSWLDIPNNTHLSHRRPENWPVKISMLQARKVCFPTDNLTSRNRKRALRKSTGRDAQEMLYTGFKAICDFLSGICNADIHNNTSYNWKNFRSWTHDFSTKSYTPLNELRNGLWREWWSFGNNCQLHSFDKWL